MVKHDILTEEEYRTFLMEIQDLINSRPFWPHHDGDIDDPPITCSDLLRPGSLIRQPIESNKASPRSRFKYIQKVVEEWWANMA